MRQKEASDVTDRQKWNSAVNEAINETTSKVLFRSRERLAKEPQGRFDIPPGAAVEQGV